jgi:hypothetical protein
MWPAHQSHAMVIFIGAVRGNNTTISVLVAFYSKDTSKSYTGDVQQTRHYYSTSNTTSSFSSSNILPYSDRIFWRISLPLSRQGSGKCMEN